MDRLTTPKQSKSNVYEVYIVSDAIDRLAQYEDTGLTPEEITVLKTEVEQLRKERNTNTVIHCSDCDHYRAQAITDGIPTDRLEAICQAERDGRCVVLPCKVGDMVYHIFGIQGIVESRARRIQVNRDGIFIVDKKGAWAENNIGKTVFLTQAEAQNALKEGKV